MRKMRKSQFCMDDGVVMTLAKMMTNSVRAIPFPIKRRCWRSSPHGRALQTLSMRQHGVRLIAINDGVDSARDDNDFTLFRNIMNEYYARDQWLVDSEATEVVKRIFAMTIEDYGLYQIASKLKSEKVLIQRYVWQGFFHHLHHS